MLRNIAKTFVRGAKINMVTKPTMNFGMVSTQMRMVHARGYNDFTDVPYYTFHDINSAMMACHNVQDYSFVFEKYSDYLTDFQIAYAFWDISACNLERLPEYWNIILPRVKEQIPTLDRNCTQALLNIIDGAATI